MRAGEEYSELTELGTSYGGGGGVGGGGGGRYGFGSGSWNRTPNRMHTSTTNVLSAEAEDILDSSASSRGHSRSRSGLYYSPPGTSYTIVERPSSAMHQHHHHHHNHHHHSATLNSPRGTYLGSNPNFSTSRTTPSNTNIINNNKKRPISPEQILRMFGNNTNCNINNNPPSAKLNSDRTSRRSPASSPPSTTHQINYRSTSSYGTPNIHELTTRTVTMIRESQDGGHGFGICVKGGKEAGVGVYISRIEEKSVAERSGLRPGDTILEVNGTPFSTITHEEALKMLKSCRKISMTVRSPTGGLGCGGASWHMKQTCSWIDRLGRPVSPPFEYSSRSGQIPNQKYTYGRSSSKDRSVRRVDLCIEPGQSLGLMIRGGLEYNLGIFITGVDKDSVADRAGLMVGDQILEVNGQSFMDVTHDEAVAQLKYHKRMSLLVKDVGKVPHSCTAYDRNWDPCSPGCNFSSRVAQTTRKWAAALQMVEEKARILLSRPEFTTLCYYTDEYASRHMTIDAFIQVMTELLNTSDKYTLMTELREIVAIEDRNKFDELVYRRDVEDRLRDSRESDYNKHLRRKAVPLPDGNHTTYAAFHEEYLSDCENQHDNRRHSTPGGSRSGSTTALHQQDYPDSSGYLGGLRSSLGGWTQKVKSWYWGRPLLSRSFDMKDDQLLEGDGSNMRRHQSMQKLARDEGQREAPRVIQDEEGNLRITVKKTKPILGIAIEGGANTKHPLPRIININENGAAYCAGGLEVGQLILQVDGTRVDGLQHQDVARLIAESFARRDREDIEFLVIEAKKSNMEPKPTALIFLEA